MGRLHVVTRDLVRRRNPLTVTFGILLIAAVSISIKVAESFSQPKRVSREHDTPGVWTES
jgi:hypothetical protein